MKKLIAIIFCVVAGTIAHGQQQAQFTQNMFNKTYINPAFTGSQKSINAFGAARFQWMGFKDSTGSTVSPRTFLFNFEAPLYSIKSGIGFSVEHDQLGYEKNLGIKLNYAFHQKIKKIHQLSFGLSMELLNKTIDFSEFSFFDEGDPLLEGLKQEGDIFTDMGVGINYYLKEKFYAGISVQRVLSSNADIGVLEFNNVPHYYFITGYHFTLKEDKYNKIVLVTGLQAKSAGNQPGFEFHTLLRYNDKFWGGLMYRWDDAVGVIAGLSVKSLSIGASYDYTISSFSNADSHGSPEVFVRYSYPLIQKIKMKGYYNPRYL